MAQLLHVFSRLQKRVLTHAIGRAADSKPVGSVDDAVAVTRDLLVNLGKIVQPQYEEAKTNAGKLFAITQNGLSDVETKLTHEIARANSDFKFSVAHFGGPPTEDLRLLAEVLKYDPNPADYFLGSLLTLVRSGSGTTLAMGNATSAKIAVCLHTVGAAFRGLIAVVAYFHQVGAERPVPLSDDIFRIDYKEPYAELEARYAKWLDACLIQGLAGWRKTLV